MARLLVVVRHSPYGSSLARSGVDTALAAAAFDQPVQLLFLGAGVLNLLPEQDAHAIGSRRMDRLLASLPLYDIENLHIDECALRRFGLVPGDLPDGARLLDSAAMRELMLDSDHLLEF